MKTKIYILIPTLALMLSAFGQKPTLELTFTAIDSASYVQLDSIKVMNRTQGGDTVLYWPDTVLILDYQVGISEISNTGENLQVFQNYPNPVKGQTTLTFYLPEKGKVNLMITDVLGRQVINTDRVLERGYHSFRFTPGSGEIFFFTAFWKGTIRSIKILHTVSKPDQASSFEYIGSDNADANLKTAAAMQGFQFNLGDTLLYIGYTDTLQSGMLDAPLTSKTYIFQFATNIPCPGTPTVTYEGQVYNTIQIFSQCWLKENLNVGAMINGIQNQQNNDTIEKYCYGNDTAKCDEYGGLYQWNEMMQYASTEGTQGICPPGWHIPTDDEWKVLEGSVDSYFGIGVPSWDYFGCRGFDAGINLKSIYGWYYGGNGTDLFGFSGLPGGVRYDDGSFLHVGCGGVWWAATEIITSNAWVRNLGNYYYWCVFRDHTDKKSGFSVRCVRD